MKKRNFKPVNLPRNAFSLIESMPEEVQKMIHGIRERKIAAGEWDFPLDVVMNPNDLDFASYYVNKTSGAYKVPRKDSGLDSYFKPFRRKSAELPNKCGSEGELRISAVGDLMFATLIEESRNHMYADVEDLIFGADYSYANLESTLADDNPASVLSIEEMGGTPEVNISKEIYQSLVSHKSRKYDLVQLANNHIMDCGEEGCLRTIKALNEDKINYIGINLDEESLGKPTIMEVDGVKIAWIAYTYSLNWKPLPQGKPWMVNVLPMHIIPNAEVDMSPLEAEVKAARESGADLVFVGMHWGLENETYPHPEQLEWAHAVAECGADAIIGHHAHCSQPYEIYKTNNFPGKHVPILYGLGNLTPAYGAASTCLSLIANLKIAKPSADRSIAAAVVGLDLEPVLFVKETLEGKELSAIMPMKELWNRELDNETRSYVEEAAEYADLVLGDSWRTD